MRTYNSKEFFPATLGPDDTLYTYNALDTCLTAELIPALLPNLIEDTSRIYAFERALQGPVLDMTTRGVCIDMEKRAQLTSHYAKKVDQLQSIVMRFGLELWGRPLNVNSPKQMQEFFYGFCNVPPIFKFVKGERKIDTGRAALETLSRHFYLRPLCQTLLALRDAQKSLGFLKSGVDPDGRFRSSYNIAGTDTGRFASGKNPRGTGWNFQNITEHLRSIFIADPGMKLGYCDLEQAESRGVALLSGDDAYWEACHAGDLHTLVTRLVWVDLEWTGDPKKDRALADRLFYRHFSRRDLAKRGGHGCLTGDHEVLTPSGWVPIGQKPSILMQWSPEGSQWASPSAWIDKEWSGTFTEIEGAALSQRLTADHRVVYRPDLRHNRVRVLPASHYTGQGAIPLGDGFCGGNPEPLARLVAAYQSDGHQKSRNRVEFHFVKERKFRRLEELAAQCGIPYHRRGSKAVLEWDCPYPKEAGRYLLLWDRESLNDYLWEMALWDGHTTRTSTTLFSTNREHLEWLQTAGRLIGIGGNIQKPYTSGFGSRVYRLQQNNRQNATGRSLTFTRMEATERVYCPTVPSGFFYIRRNGKISVTGNSNYYGKPSGLAKQLYMPTDVIERFQAAYFTAFPGIQNWHREVAYTLQTEGILTTPFGRRRQFHGRLRDDATLRAAIAYLPQSLIVDIVNRGMLDVWRVPRVQVLGQVHDAVFFQYPEEREAEILPEVQACMAVPVHHRGKTLTIPSEMAVGWNFEKYSESNPDGMKKWKGGDDRQRTTEQKKSLLDYRF